MEAHTEADRIQDLEAQVEALQRFKSFVHTYLDGKGIPHHPPGTHGAEGCRIGDRMDYVFAELERQNDLIAHLKIAENGWLAEYKKAVAELAALRERAKALEAGLKPFADYGSNLDKTHYIHDFETVLLETHGDVPNISVGDCRRAAALLVGEGKTDG